MKKGTLSPEPTNFYTTLETYLGKDPKSINVNNVFIFKDLNARQMHAINKIKTDFKLHPEAVDCGIVIAEKMGLTNTDDILPVIEMVCIDIKESGN